MTPARRRRLHLTLAAGLLLCALGFVVEAKRATDGHLPAWVYVFEWPLFAVVGVFMWWRLLHDDDRPAGEPKPFDAAPAEPVDDPELAAWQDYVARLDTESTDRP